MHIQKIYLIKIIVLTAAIIAAVFLWSAKSRESASTAEISMSQQGQNIRGVIVPHHAPLTSLIDGTIKQVSDSGAHPKTVILIGPNHPDAGIGPALTRLNSWDLPVGEVLTNTTVTQELIDDGFVLVDENVLPKEHSMYAVLPVIHKYFPNAKVVTVILSTKHDKNRSKRLGEKIGSLLGPDTLLVASIDFSHYLSSDIAPLKDEETLDLIEKRDYDAIERTLTDHFDSGPSLMTFLRAVDFGGAATGELVYHTNSGLFAGEPIQSSTSYMTFIFRR